MTVVPDEQHFSRTRWLDWLPTPTNLTVGNGTVVGRFVQLGDLVIAFYQLTFGSTTSISGDVTIPLPVTAAESSLANTAGPASFTDTGTARFHGMVKTDGRVRVMGASATHVTEGILSSTVPFTWTTNDILQFTATYEVA